MKRLSLLLATAVAMLCSFASNAQMIITTTSTSVVENFDVMGSSNTATLPTGFKIGTDWSTGTAATTQAFGTTGAGVVTGTSSGGTVNWASGVTASATDRALGFLNTGSYTSPRSIILKITNNTGVTITSLDVAFDYEKYRSGIRAFGWTFFHGSSSAPSTSASAGDQSYPADANNTTVSNPPITNNKTVSLTGLVIPDGSDYYLRWTFTGVGGSTNGQGIGIDNVSVTVTATTSCTPPSNQPTALSLTPDVTSISGSFTAAATGTTAADNYLVLRSASSTLSSQPANGTAYTAGSTLGNATVVSAGSSTSFTSSSLTAGTTYYFFVYSYTTANCYNLASPLSGSVATSGAPTASVAGGTNASEPSTNGTFTVTLTSAAPAGGITINYTLSGTAIKNSDYTDPQNGSVTIAQGATTATITLNTTDELVAEPVETIIITLDNITAPYVIAAANTATINLSDDDTEPISFTGAYSQDFDALATTGSSSALPTGWMLYETGTNANTTYTATDGATTSGNTYSFGTGTATDRALGGIRSGNLVPVIGGIFTNNTGSTVSSLSITYKGEQWRLGTTGRADRIDFQYSTNATKLNNGTWTDVDALDFIAPVSSGTAGALDGNTNSRTITYTLSGLSIPNGSTFLVRWTDYDATSSDDGLGVDDLTITLGCTAPTNQPTVLSLTPSLQSISGVFNAAAPGTTPADEYLVVMSTSSALSMPPASGTVYAVDDEIGNGVVVASGSSTSFTVNSLTPGTTYYFFVYATSSATSCYNITSPLTANVATTTPPPCTSPTTQATGLSGTNITGSSMDISYTRGNGDNILVLARVGSAVNANPTSGSGYTVGNQVGSGNYVVYNGPANSFSYSGLTQNTTYYFAAYEYFSTDNCYNLAPLTGSFSTICSAPVDVNAVSATAANGQVTVRWTNPVAGCFDEVLVVASNASVTAQGSTFGSTANATYTGGSQVVYIGTSNSVVVTGLTNGTTYFFKVFGKLGTNYSGGVQVTATPYDPATGFQYLYGNLHAHSSYSDGNKDDLTKTPKDDYIFARDAQCMDFLGISEHNHAGAGMAIADFKLGYSQADEVNMIAGGTSGNSMVTLFGMEWGVISGGGHVLVYGFDDQLIGWETANYDIYVAKNDYASLWTAVNARPGAVATLAHPSSTDYGGIASTFSQAADNAIYGVAVASGPAFSTSTTYSDFPSSLSYLSYYKTMLAKGYHLAPQMDQDNHNMTFGTANANRMVVLATTKTREGVMDAIRNMRYYASEDCNLQVAFNQGTRPMGSSVVSSGLPAFSITATDVLPAEESTASIELWAGQVGGTAPVAPIKTYTNTTSVTLNATDAENAQPNNTTYYYFAIITQADGNKAVTAPIWYTRSDVAFVALPVTLAYFKGGYNEVRNVVDLAWETAQEVNSKEFVVERSTGNSTWTAIGTVKAAGNSTQNKVYNFTDLTPVAGKSLYRLRQVDNDGKATASRTVSITYGKEGQAVYSVFPNPAAGFTNVYSSSAISEKVIIRVVDQNGRILKTVSGTTGNGTPYRLSTDGIGAGVYLLQVEGTGNHAEKLIITK
jgi:trimeric autotransporter adhesin